MDIIGEICETVAGPVSAEVVATESEQMIAEGERLAAIASMTLCFSANQALLAAKTRATFISPFVGRLDDIDVDGMELVRTIRTIYDNYQSLTTEILASSMGTPLHTASTITSTGAPRSS